MELADHTYSPIRPALDGYIKFFCGSGASSVKRAQRKIDGHSFPLSTASIWKSIGRRTKSRVDRETLVD